MILQKHKDDMKVNQKAQIPYNKISCIIAYVYFFITLLFTFIAFTNRGGLLLIVIIFSVLNFLLNSAILIGYIGLTFSLIGFYANRETIKFSFLGWVCGIYMLSL